MLYKYYPLKQQGPMFYGVFFLLLGIILDVLKVAYHKKHTKIKKQTKNMTCEKD